MRISAVVVAMNEGRDLEGTVMDLCRSYWPIHEVIVVDDSSNDPELESVTIRMERLHFPEVRVVRTETNLGAGPAKRLGCLEASGDIIIVSDSHMRIPDLFDQKIISAVERYPQAIFCTPCHGFNGTIHGGGAEFDARSPCGLGRRWVRAGLPHAIDPVPMLLGAFYLIPRTIGETIDWFSPYLRGWGCGEQDVSLKAWMAGYEVRIINELPIQHRFGRGNSNVPNSTVDNACNQIMVLTLLAGKNIASKYIPSMRPLLTRRGMEVISEQIDAADEYGRQLRASFPYQFDDLSRLCRFHLPTVDENIQYVSETIARQSGQAGISIRSTLRPGIGQRHREMIIDAVPWGGRMLEWGAGGSTLWFREQLAAKNATLTTIEHSATWAAKVAGGQVILHELEGIIPGRPAAERLPNTNHICTDTTIPYVACDGLGTFHVALVDGVLRNACLTRMAKRDGLIQPGGYVFLHDSQRAGWYHEGEQALRTAGYVEHSHQRTCPDLHGPRLKCWRVPE